MHHFALLGNPIHHSLSPHIHHLFAQQTQQKINYEKICVTRNKLSQTIHELKLKKYKGLNITSPFKEEAFQLANELSERAKRAKAINTICFKEDGTIYGDNTDGIGLLTDLTIHKKISLNNKKILILGAGGAVRGILPALLDHNAHVTLKNRTFEKAKQLQIEFNLTDCLISSSARVLTARSSQPFDLIINATSLDIFETDTPKTYFHPQTFCYDLNYQPVTPFLAWAKSKNLSHCNGLGMLVEQAAEAFFLWHNTRPNTKLILENLFLSLEHSHSFL